MFKNYLKIAFRNLKRYKGYSFINIFGLTIGMTCCIFIFLYVHHEMSYDSYHTDHERIFRVAEEIRTQTANRVFAQVPCPAAAALQENVPQVENAGRVMPMRPRLVKYQDKVFYEGNLYAADPEILHIFTMPFLKGNRAEALLRPKTLVITERMAVKYFARQDPVGKMINMNDEDYDVTGVVADPPANTHWKYDLILSLRTFAKEDFMTNWYGTEAYTYIKLVPQADVHAVAQQVRHLADRYVGEQLKARGVEYNFFLQPLADIHLYSHLRYEAEPPGDPQMITMFSTIGLLVLLIACINFINLTTARSVYRAKEVGLRKVVGGRRKQLVLQFVGESFILALISLLAAMTLAGFIIPLFNHLTGSHFASTILYQPPALAIMLALVLFIGLVAGLYPAFILSRYKPVSVLKASPARGPAKSLSRRVLVLLQFSIAIILIIVTITVQQQLKFMKHQYLGFDQEQKLVIPFRRGLHLEENYPGIKERFLRHPGILNATVSSSVPGREISNFGVRLVGEEDDKNQSMFHFHFDPDFIPNFNIKMIAGRAFHRDLRTDEGKTCLLNRAAVEAFGWSSPRQALGKIVKTGYGGRDLKIIGVTENFHYRGLQSRVEPLVMEWLPELFGTMTLTVNTRKTADLLAFTKRTWADLFPGNPFEYYFLEDDFNAQYLAEERAGSLFGVFTLLGQIIACLGLLGLAAFTTRQRSKEIGVRKVLGASTAGITLLISKEFLKWVVLANFIAWPLAYLAVNRWLSGFAYRTPVGIFSFVVSALLVLLVAVLTVSFQSIRAAAANPIKALRYE